MLAFFCNSPAILFDISDIDSLIISYTYIYLIHFVDT
jgi:hypothetical protein